MNDNSEPYYAFLNNMTTDLLELGAQTSSLSSDRRVYIDKTDYDEIDGHFMRKYHIRILCPSKRIKEKNEKQHLIDEMVKDYTIKLRKDFGMES
jgi:hypothetical protein